jgi:hypothetical protein
MSRLPVTESSEGQKTPVTLTSVKSKRNRLMTWDRNVQGFNKSGGVTPGSKNSITIWTLGFVGKLTKFLSLSLAKLPYALLKFSYEIAKIFTGGLSTIRRLLFMPK